MLSLAGYERALADGRMTPAYDMHIYLEEDSIPKSENFRN